MRDDAQRDTALDVGSRVHADPKALGLHGGPGAGQHGDHNVNADKALLYVRPHLLDIELLPNGGNHFPATVVRINPAGPQVKVELRAQWGDVVQVELGHERFRSLGLTPGAEVFVRPKEAKVFVYQI